MTWWWERHGKEGKHFTMLLEKVDVGSVVAARSDETRAHRSLAWWPRAVSSDGDSWLYDPPSAALS